MAIAVIVIVVGLIVGVAIELVLSERKRSRRGLKRIDPQAVSPSPPQPPQPRFIDDGEGFRIIGPLEYDDAGPAPWERDEEPGGQSSPDAQG